VELTTTGSFVQDTLKNALAHRRWRGTDRSQVRTRMMETANLRRPKSGLWERKNLFQIGKAPSLFRRFRDQLAGRERQVRLAPIPNIPIFQDPAEIERQIVIKLESAQREVEDLKPLLKAYLKLGSYAGELEQRTHEMNLLNKMGDMLLTCDTTEEAYEIIQQQAQQIFPVKVGALYVSTLKDNIIELKREAVWGECLLAIPEFARNDCWAVRINHIYRVRRCCCFSPSRLQRQAAPRCG